MSGGSKVGKRNEHNCVQLVGLHMLLESFKIISIIIICDLNNFHQLCLLVYPTPPPTHTKPVKEVGKVYLEHSPPTHPLPNIFILYSILPPPGLLPNPMSDYCLLPLLLPATSLPKYSQCYSRPRAQ